MATFVVTATRLRANVDGKTRVRFFRGDKISGLSDEDVARFKAAGAIASPKDDTAKAATDAAEADPSIGAPHPSEVSDPAVESAPVDPNAASAIVAEANTNTVRKPAQAATQEAWAKYAVESGQLTEAEAGRLSKAELHKRVK